MNTLGYFVTWSLSLPLLVLLIYSWRAFNRSESGSWTCGPLIALSGLLLLTNVRVTPGGPFVSVHANILPVVGCLTTLIIAAFTMRAGSITRRILMLLVIVASLSIIGLVVADVLSYWFRPFSRGALFGW